MTGCRFLLSGVFVALIVLSFAAGAVPAQQNSNRIKLEPCKIPNLNEEGRCGTLEVYEDREARSGRKISLNILVLPALNPKPAPDPVFFLEGGPGVSAVNTAKSGGRKGLINRWRTARDVVFVDQRGTGESNPLQCDFAADLDDMAAYFSTALTYDRVAQCRDKLEKKANLALYTTSIAMDDLDDVRSALGYEKINIYGGSYGTRAGLVYLRRHGDHVRAAVLEGVSPTEYQLPLTFAKGVQNALDRLFDDCSADPACHKAFPDLKADFISALKSLDKGPVKVQSYNPIKKQPQEITVSRPAFLEQLRFLLYSPELMQYVPQVIHQSAQGDFGGAAMLAFVIERQLLPIINQGMELSVICAEDAPFITEDKIKEATSGTYYGETTIRSVLNACKGWPRGKVPADYSEPVKSEVPVLMISGEIDPVTPASIGAKTARFLTHSRQIVGRSWSHGSSSDCADGLMAAFITAGTSAGLDASCMDKVTRPAFFTEESVMAPTSHAAGTVETVCEGVLEIASQKLRIVLHLFKSPDGSYSGALDSPDQNSYGFAVDVVKLSEGALHLEIKFIGASYDGKLSQDGSSFEGVFRQGPINVPLVLKKK